MDEFDLESGYPNITNAVSPDGGNQASQFKHRLIFGSPPTIAYESDDGNPPTTISSESDDRNQAILPEPFLFLTAAQPPGLHRSRCAPALLNSEFKSISSPAAAFPRARRRSDSEYKKVAIILSIYLGAGTVCFYLVRHQMSGKKTNDILDALYFTVVSMTSVGYGDLSPDGTGSNTTCHCLCHVGYASYWGSNRVRNLCIILVVVFVVLMAVGTVVLVLVEDLDYIHAFYCINTIITSVGSDQCFSTKGGRVFALFWIFSGSVYLGLVIFTFSEQHTQRRQESIQKWALQRKITVDDFLGADIDHVGFLRKTTYVLHKLQQIGKISQEDIIPFLRQFDRNDVTGNGKLTLADLLS